MDDRSRAISKFAPSAKGGMVGGSSTPPGPFGDPSFILLNSEENLQLPGTSEGQGRARRDSIQEFKKKKSLDIQYRNALINCKRISRENTT